MKKTILVIDDSEELRENIEEILSLANYNVLTARQGKEGVDLMKKTKPDLVLCDIMMPELDGFGVLNAIENNDEISGIPFIFLSAKADKMDIRAGMDKGADDYLTKPFSAEQLLKTVNARLKKSNTLKDPYRHEVKDLEEFFSGEKMFEDLQFPGDKMQYKKIKKGDAIFAEGDGSNYLYFLVKGKVKTYKINEFGKEYIIRIYRDGDFFGHLALLNDNIHRKSAAALDTSEVAFISKNEFYQLIHSNSDLSIKLIKNISNILIEAQERMIKLAYNSARKKLADALTVLNRKYNPENENLPFSANRENLSAMAGITPESVSRNLTEFRNEQLIEYENGMINILNIQKLMAVKN